MQGAVLRYCYIGIAVEVGLQVGAQRGRVVWVVVGQVPFLLDPIADEDKEDGARQDIGRGKEKVTGFGSQTLMLSTPL